MRGRVNNLTRDPIVIRETTWKKDQRRWSFQGKKGKMLWGMARAKERGDSKEEPRPAFF